MESRSKVLTSLNSVLSFIKVSIARPNCALSWNRMCVFDQPRCVRDAHDVRCAGSCETGDDRFSPLVAECAPERAYMSRALHSECQLTIHAAVPPQSH